MTKKVYDTAVEVFELLVKRLRKGYYSVKDCTQYIDETIEEALMSIEDFNAKSDARIKLYRKAWRMMLEATKGW